MYSMCIRRTVIPIKNIFPERRYISVQFEKRASRQNRYINFRNNRYSKRLHDLTIILPLCRKMKWIPSIEKVLNILQRSAGKFTDDLFMKKHVHVKENAISLCNLIICYLPKFSVTNLSSL